MAPESIYAMQWEMADANEPFTQDWDHVEACYQWVTNIPGVRVNNKCARPQLPTPHHSWQLFQLNSLNSVVVILISLSGPHTGKSVFSSCYQLLHHLDYRLTITFHAYHTRLRAQTATDKASISLPRSKIAYAGFSRGGYSAAALASRVGRATHCMEFHSSTTNSMVLPPPELVDRSSQKCRICDVKSVAIPTRGITNIPAGRRVAIR